MGVFELNRRSLILAAPFVLARPARAQLLLGVTGSRSGGSVVVVTTPTMWNASDKNNITLSGGNLTALCTSGSGGVRAIAGLNAGKFYFEATTSTFTIGYIGLGLVSANLGSGGTTGAVAINQAGNIYLDGTSSGTNINTGMGLVGIAADLSGRLIWFRSGAAGSWNATSGTANNPATGTGGFSFSTVSGTLFPWFNPLWNGAQAVANFGASAFSGAVPAGFASGWLS